MNILLKPFYKFSTSIGEKFFVVTHHYVKDMYYERILYRKQHEELLKKLEQKGNQIIGAPFFPMDGACYIFNSKDDSAVKEFIQKDPYVKNNLVSSYEVEEVNQITDYTFDKLANSLNYK